MSKESGRVPRNQFILITTDSPSDRDNRIARTLQKQPSLRNETLGRRIPRPESYKEDHADEKESSSSRLMCSICLNTRCQKCLKQTDNENHADSCPGIVHNSPQNKCPRCYRIFDEPRIDSLDDSKGAKLNKEMRNVATQDSRMLVTNNSDDKVVQTSKTDMGNIDLLKLVLKLSDCPCKKNCKSNEHVEQFIKEKCKYNDVRIPNDCFNENDHHVDREYNTNGYQCVRKDNVIETDRGIEFEEPTKLMKLDESEIKNKKSKLVAMNVCQISFGKSVEDFLDNKSRCTVVNSMTMSERMSEERQFNIILKSKSSSVPQMKIEELKKSLREKKKSKDAIEEVNRMFANVRKNDSSDASESELNRPSTRTGPRILPFVKSPEQQKSEAMGKMEESNIKVCDCPLKISQNCRHQKNDVKKCLYTLCCHHKRFDHEMCCQGDQKNKRKERVCHCHHGSKRAGYIDESDHDFNSSHTSSTFS